MASIERALGRSLPIEVDDAAQRPVIVAGVARAVSSWTHDPVLLELIVKPRLRRVRVVRDEGSRPDCGPLEADGTVRCTQRGTASALDSSLRHALRDELLRRFARRSLSDVSPAELPLYLRAVDYLIPYVSKAPRDEAIEVLERLRLELAIERRARGTPVAETAEESMLGRLQRLVRLHDNAKSSGFAEDPSVVRTGTEVSVGLREWLDARLLAMPDPRRARLLDALLGRDMNCRACPPVPQFDHLALALRILAMGRSADGRAAVGPITSATLLCPYRRGPGDRFERDEQGVQGPMCGDSLAKALTRDDAGAAQLAALLAQGVDDPFLMSALAEGDARRLLLALAGHPDTLRQALRLAIAEDTPARVAAWSTAASLWPRVPAARGALLLVLADGYSRGGRDTGLGVDLQWERFEADFGARVDAVLLESMLREGPLALERLPTMWRGLRAIPRPMTVIEPHLDRYLDTSSTFARTRVLEPLAARLCQEPRRQGLDRLLALLARRAAAGRPNPALTTRLDTCRP